MGVHAITADAMVRMRMYNDNVIAAQLAVPKEVMRMEPQTREQILQKHGDMLAGCCLDHPEPDWSGAIVKKVIRWWDHSEGLDKDYPGDSDGSRIAMFLTDDGRFGVLEDSEDYTGHGCQCDSAFAVFDNIAQALALGLTEEDAANLNLTLQRTDAIAGKPVAVAVGT